MYVIVAYDFNEKRVAKALKISRKYLTPVQNSIFEGDLTLGQLQQLKMELEKVMDPEIDSLILFMFDQTYYATREIIGVDKTVDNFII